MFRKEFKVVYRLNHLCRCHLLGNFVIFQKRQSKKYLHEIKCNMEVCTHVNIVVSVTVRKHIVLTKNEK